MQKMPSQIIPDGTNANSATNEIKVKTAYNGEIMITYIDENITYENLCHEIRGICRFPTDQVSDNIQFLLNIYLIILKLPCSPSPSSGWTKRMIRARYQRKWNWTKLYVCTK